jgi:hypothetical protein
MQALHDYCFDDGVSCKAVSIVTFVVLDAVLLCIEAVVLFPVVVCISFVLVFTAFFQSE